MSKNKSVYAHCVYQTVIVPRKEAAGYYAEMFRPLQRCVEIAAGNFAGVRIGNVVTEPDYLYINLLIPPQHAVSTVISAVKMRTHAMLRKSSITKGFIRENDDFRAWCDGYYVSTANKRDVKEIATFVAKSLADDTRQKILVWHKEDEHSYTERR